MKKFFGLMLLFVAMRHLFVTLDFFFDFIFYFLFKG